MHERYLIPSALILIILLAACSGGQTAELSQAEASQAEVTESEAAEPVAEASHDGDMDDMEEEGQDDDMDSMEGEGHDDDMDDMEEEGDDDDMAEDSHDDDMDAMEGEGNDDDMEAMEKEDGDMAEESMAAAGLPAWQTIALTNVATGEEFTLGDFQGKTVFVEPMATWCSNCRAQQGHVSQAKMQLGDEVVFIGLSLESNLPSEELASYAQGNGFDWTYAVIPVNLLAELSDEFGRSITSAPSTPHFIIRPDGSFSELATGIHSADEIVSEIQAEQG